MTAHIDSAVLGTVSFMYELDNFRRVRTRIHSELTQAGIRHNDRSADLDFGGIGRVRLELARGHLRVSFVLRHTLETSTPMSCVQALTTSLCDAVPELSGVVDANAKLHAADIVYTIETAQDTTLPSIQQWIQELEYREADVLCNHRQQTISLAVEPGHPRYGYSSIEVRPETLDPRCSRLRIQLNARADLFASTLTRAHNMNWRVQELDTQHELLLHRSWSALLNLLLGFRAQTCVRAPREWQPSARRLFATWATGKAVAFEGSASAERQRLGFDIQRPNRKHDFGANTVILPRRINTAMFAKRSDLLLRKRMRSTTKDTRGLEM
jgi:hypothetical protein